MRRRNRGDGKTTARVRLNRRVVVGNGAFALGCKNSVA
jgi:hypothetical protein